MAERFIPPQSERGAALLTVLLLVAVMAVITATALDRLRLSTRLAVNGAAMAQARAYSLAAEGIARFPYLSIAGKRRCGSATGRIASTSTALFQARTDNLAPVLSGCVSSAS